MIDEKMLREEMARFAKSLFDRGFSFGASGNISVRLDDGLLMTPTNSSLGFLDPERISKVDWDGQHIAGDPPSKEGPLHRAFYETRPGTNAVVHLHSTYATAYSCLADIDPEDCLPPITPYAIMRVGPVRLIPYRRPGHDEMADLIRELDGRYATVLLANHGPVVAGSDLASAVAAAEELELTAHVLLTLHGRDVRHLTPEQVAELQKVFGGK